MEKRKKGSGSKENVGRKSRPYAFKRISKEVPEAIYTRCIEFIEEEVSKFKNNL